MRVLVVAPEIPFPPLSGGQTRTFQLLKALASQHEVTLVAFGFENRSAGPSLTTPFPIEIVSVPWETPRLYLQMRGDDETLSRAAYQALMDAAAEPWMVSCNPTEPMIAALERLVERPWDLVFIEHTSMGKYLAALPQDVPRILDLHNVHSLMATREASTCSGEHRSELTAEAERIRRFERRVCQACDVVVTCSDAESEAVARLLGVSGAIVIPNGVDLSAMSPTAVEPVAGRLLFTGTMDYEPNIQAVKWFCANVLPSIRAENSSAHLHIAGANPTADVLELASDQVVVHGFVPDMQLHFAGAEVVVVPLLHGGGTRLKILDAAACGKPIVSTALGAEGLQMISGQHLMLADTPAEFAAATSHLLASPGEREKLGRAAREKALEYDWSLITNQLIGLVESWASETRPHGTQRAKVEVTVYSKSATPRTSVRE